MLCRRADAADARGLGCGGHGAGGAVEAAEHQSAVLLLPMAHPALLAGVHVARSHSL